MSNPKTEETYLNGICPYLTMFPLKFPLGILRTRARRGEIVLDPFCGRGTTGFAARLLGLDSLGVDSSPVAVAITAAKLAVTTPDDIVAEARAILEAPYTKNIPVGEFWEWAYHRDVLASLSRLREAFLEECTTPARVALRGIVLGALHGPKQKTFQSYFSNQCPRTYAPKPAYATRFWKNRSLTPENVDIKAIVERKARRYYGSSRGVSGMTRLADSRVANALLPNSADSLFNWVITSPPYYGMRTYKPDQWLRNWFVGGADSVVYPNGDQIAHSSPEDFTADLKKVWKNVAGVCTDTARMVIRFGGINDRKAEPLELIKNSLKDTGWRITAVRRAGTAVEGRRQADAFLRVKTEPTAEYDIWTIKSEVVRSLPSAPSSLHV